METMQTATVKIAKALQNAGIPFKFVITPLRQPTDKEKESTFDEFGKQKFMLCDDGSNVELAISLTNRTRGAVDAITAALGKAPKDRINNAIDFARWMLDPQTVVIFHTASIRIVEYGYLVH